jgi:glucose-6-phosphate isomerase
LWAEGAGLCLDYSKNAITVETIRLRLALADECGLHDR